MDDFFAPPAFKPDEALMALRRQLRESRSLSERGDPRQPRFEWRGLPAVELRADAGVLVARWVDKPLRSPAWKEKRLASSADVRSFAEEVKRCLRRWDDED